MIEDHPDIVRRVTGEVVILRAEALFLKSCIEYIGLCEKFDELTEGEEIPSYDVEYDLTTDSVVWMRRDT